MPSFFWAGSFTNALLWTYRVGSPLKYHIPRKHSINERNLSMGSANNSKSKCLFSTCYLPNTMLSTLELFHSIPTQQNPSVPSYKNKCFLNPHSWQRIKSLNENRSYFPGDSLAICKIKVFLKLPVYWYTLYIATVYSQMPSDFSALLVIFISFYMKLPFGRPNWRPKDKTFFSIL